MANRLFLSFRRAPGKGKGMFGGSILLQQVIKKRNLEPPKSRDGICGPLISSLSLVSLGPSSLSFNLMGPKKMTREKREDNYAHILRCHHLIQHMSVDS